MVFGSFFRVLGNVGAHAGDQEVESYQVEALDQFFRAVVEYVYVAPSRLSRFREELEERWKGEG
jgi:hypothetical protein